EDTLLEQPAAELDRERRFPDDDRHDRRLAVEGLEAECTEALAELSGLTVQLRDQLRLAPQDAHRLERRARDRRRQRVREELRSRALGEDVADLLARGDEAARRAAERLPERGGDHVDLAQEAVVLGDAAARLADHAGA